MTPTGAAVADPALWREVVGQDRAVAELQGALAHPVHAFLFVGPKGSGKRSLAAAFAAGLLADGLEGADRERVIDLVLAERHPDLHIVQRVGASISADQAREVREVASRSPIESSRKVLVLDEFHLVADAVGPILLKTIEEPPPDTFFLILVEDVPREMVTIASRCVRVDLGPVPDDAIRARLEAEGVDPVAAAEVAAAAAGDLGRARLLATDPQLAARRTAWAVVAGRVDGSGHAATVLVDHLLELIEAAAEPLKARHGAEIAELDARIKEYGERGSGKKELESRHKRELRRHRTDELRFGLAVVARRYRDALVHTDRPGPYIEALAAIDETAGGLIRNPNERLQLVALFLRLPTLPD